jgi:ATP-dependent helicase Lhr and Lhr-like helicase
MPRPGESSPVFDWFARRFGRPTLAQRKAWPLIRARKNVLIASPTGTGKTLAAFLGVLDQLAHLQEHDQLLDSIYCLYISPLRALAYDLEKNLRDPLREIYGDESPIRVGMRTGDTSQAERQRQLRKPPHILLTTPESLCLLLSQNKWLPILETVRWAIVDEIHSLAENKRGAHLSLSLERLSHEPGPGPGRKSIRRSPLQRIGLSATVAPLPEVGRFLVGTRGHCEIVDVATAKKIDLRVHTPLRRNPYPESGYTGQRLIRELATLVRRNRTTLVFTNTRSGAEAASYWLREAAPEIADRIECHHASLDRDLRQDVEDRLKRGELRAVVCSTSLELGIDIGSIDLVVMLSTPKGVSKALQRTGRSGHNIHTTSRGLIMATNVNDLVESCATVLLGRTRHLDRIRFPDAPLDILAQHLVSMGCNAAWSRSHAFALVRGAYPYAHLTQSDFDDVLDYLAGGGQALRAQYTEVFGKIDLNSTAFRTRPGRVQRDFLQNVGVIPDVGSINVRLKSRKLGSVEEGFLRILKPGDVFIISGRPVRLERVDQMEAFVTRADGELPTVPRWNANKMPLSTNVAHEIVAFRTALRQRFEAAPQGDHAAWIAERLDCGKSNAAIIQRMYRAQHATSEIPTAAFLLVESFLEAPPSSDAVASRHYFFHSVLGRAANDALSRVVTRRLGQLRGGNAIATSHDYGFVLSVGEEQRIGEEDFADLLSPEGFREDLDEALDHSHMLKYHFRNAAQTGLMVYRNYFGQRKPVRKLQWSAEVIYNVLHEHEPNHVLLREARRDAMRVFVDADTAADYLRNAVPVRLREIDRVPPLSFAMYATKIKEALLVEDPAETMERLFNIWWNDLEEVQ